MAKVVTPSKAGHDFGFGPRDPTLLFFLFLHSLSRVEPPPESSRKVNGLAAPLWTRHPRTARSLVVEQFFPVRLLTAAQE